MLRVHFSDADLGRTRVAAAPDPLWEIATSLHRLQTRTGRWAYAGWYRTVRTRLREHGLERALRTVLLPLFPRAAYFPDFLTPAQSAEGFDAGLDAIVAAPPWRIRYEMATLDRVVGAPSWAPRLAETQTRHELVRVLRAYYEVAVTPYREQIQVRIDAERSARARGILDGGVEGMLDGLGPAMRWRRPVLHVEYPTKDRDLLLNGRGLTLVPSYFSWRTPNSLADPALPPVLCYPVLREPAAPPPGIGIGTGIGSEAGHSAAPLASLLGRARAAALLAVAGGATTGEIARAVGVSASAASRHATALRDAGLITTSRHAASVLHTLTPVGASVLRAGTRAAQP
ncbi:ArsR/SmtB family transcription factor [Streptomyces vilmorinianum]|uniref:ArsR/SmtB family transcription factor n=1 Tax=Streptomyces vilmorinianum TaxID=3051092 RepID=UPI0010FB02E4|nr:helix-turn-helix domain-containing protein [Streptomyces vilmorinianum]